MTTEAQALAALDRERLTADLCELVRVRSVTGDERAAMERLRELAAARGLWAQLHQHDLRELRAHPGHPGEEVERFELWGVTGTLPTGPGAGAPRLALCGHVDVVDPGTEAWEHDPFGGEVADGYVYGRGAADMKGGVIAALHAMAAVLDADVELACEPDLLAVASEEDGGLGAFAALQRDAGYAACLIPEPTGFDVVCAQAGAVTFRGVVHGRAAHAAQRLQGVSAIDRYLPIHQALRDLEVRLNTDVKHPLMRELALPYPLVVGRVESGTWSSTVPDRLEFEGRAPVRIGESIEEAIAGVEAAVASAVPAGDPPVELEWTGGRFGAAETARSNAFARLVREAVGATTMREPDVVGVPWGADMRLFTARQIPTVMVGTHGIDRAHAVDERVAIDDVHHLAEALVRVICRFGT